MELKLLISHFSLSVTLFLITNWIGNHSIHAGYIRMSVLAKADEAPAFNFLYRVFSPIVFITLASAISYKLQQDWLTERIYLVVIYYFALRIFFNLATGRGRLLNWGTQFAYISVSLPISYYVYDTLIKHKDFLFPTPKELGSALWLAIVAYAYHTFNSIKLSNERTRTRKASYLKHRYENYKKLYGTIIEGIAETKKQEALIYAVLIFEAFNRPKLYRLIENVLFHFGISKTLGIMQVTTGRYIDDKESVRLGATKIVKDHLQAKLNIEARRYPGNCITVRREVLALYNPDDDYINEVDDIYEEIINKFYPNETTDWKKEIELNKQTKEETINPSQQSIDKADTA